MALERFNDGSSFVAAGSHITFRDFGTYFGGKEHKTHLFEVLAKADSFKLGEIVWFSRWRKYIFAPNSNTIFEETCLRDISQFIEEETKAQKESAKSRKVAKHEI
jgi:hypothetical protein